MTATDIFKHDIAFSGGFQDAANADRRAVEAFGDALAGTDRPFVLASGLPGLAPGRVATEQDGLDPVEGRDAVEIRRGTGQLTLSLADRGVRRPSSGCRRRCTGRETGASWRRWSASPVTWRRRAGLIGADSPASSTLTRELLGWRPTQPGLIDDLDKGHYFQTA